MIYLYSNTLGDKPLFSPPASVRAACLEGSASPASVRAAGVALRLSLPQ